MPSAIAAGQQAASPNRHGRPNYDDAVDDFMRDLELDNDTNNPPAPAQDAPKDIDEEVQVRKKRKPNPKLDEARLLSQNGIPKLRRLAKSRLKFRGKGYEYSDITTLLNMYQLWLDDLYPKAKFKDGLAMVEKVGHSKRMQITRRAWLDATKPHQREESPERLGDVQMSGGLGDAEGEGEARGGGDGQQSTPASDTRQQQEGRRRDNDAESQESAPEEDELDALLNEGAGAGTGPAQQEQAPARGPFEEGSDVDEDELDALLAEQDDTGARAPSDQRDGPSRAVSGGGGDDFADDEEAMASMGW